MLAQLYYTALGAVGAGALARAVRDAGVVLCYHNVAPRDPCGPGEPGLHLPLDRFESQMRWLVRHYNVVSLREFVGLLQGGGSLRDTAAVTFDDAYAGVFRFAAPVLTALEIPATVFVVAEAPGGREAFWWDRASVTRAATPAQMARWLTELKGDGAAIVNAVAPGTEPELPDSHRPADWETIVAAGNAGFEIGVHSATHRSLPMLDARELEQEIVASRARIAQRTGTAPQFFAYPYGRWDRRVRGVVEAAGYLAALTLDYGLSGVGADPLALRRVNIPAGIRQPAFEAWTAGLSLRGVRHA